jgi:hypothetical protein
MRRSCPVVLAALLAFGVLAAAGDAGALPRYSAQYGQRCALCHVNPTGGGPRTLYASQMIVPEELSFSRYQPEAISAIRPDLTPAVSVGLDLRNLFMYAEGGRGDQVAMQADVHVVVEADQSLTAFLTLGNGGTQEYGGIAYILPLDGYIKVGRFTPDYGWRWEDHFMASRRYLLAPDGNPNPGYLRQTGIEVGAHTQTVEVTASLIDDIDQEHESYAGHIVLRHSPGAVNLAIGTSYLRQEGSLQQPQPARAWGGFGYASVGPATWVFEVDETGNGVHEGRLISQELTWRLRQGLHLRGIYSFQDPDRHQQTGARERWGVGFDLLATPFFGAQAMLNRYTADRGALVTDQDQWRGELVLHVLY